MGCLLSCFLWLYHKICKPREDATDGPTPRDGRSLLTPDSGIHKSKDRKQQEIDRLSEQVKEIDQRLQDSEDQKRREIERLSEQVKERDQRLRQSEGGQQEEIARLSRLLQESEQRFRQSEGGKQQEIAPHSRLLKQSEQRLRQLEGGKQQEIARLSRLLQESEQRLRQAEDGKQQEIARLSRLLQESEQRLQDSEDRKQHEIERLSEKVKERDQSLQRVMSDNNKLKRKIDDSGEENKRRRQPEDSKQQEIERLSRLLQESEQRLRQAEGGKQQEIAQLSRLLQESEQSVQMLHRQLMERDVQFQEDLSDPLRPSAIATMFKDAQKSSLRVSQQLIDSCCQRGGDATAGQVCAVPVFICELFQFIFDKAQDKATQWNNSVNRVLSSDGIIDICIKDGTRKQAVVVETSNRRPNIPMVDINASMRKDINKRDCKEFLPFLETAIKTYSRSSRTNIEFLTQLQENREFKEFLTEIFKLSLLIHLSTPPLKILTKEVAFDKKIHVHFSGRACSDGLEIKYVWPALVSDKGVHVLGKVFTGNDFSNAYL